MIEPLTSSVRWTNPSGFPSRTLQWHRGISSLSRIEQVPWPPSHVEHRPTDGVAQPLIVEHQPANAARELFALPAALGPAGAQVVALSSSCTHSLDRVG